MFILLRNFVRSFLFINPLKDAEKALTLRQKIAARGGESLYFELL